MADTPFNVIPATGSGAVGFLSTPNAAGYFATGHTIYLNVNGVAVPVGASQPMPVTLTFPTTQPVSGSVSIGNFPVTQPVSGSISVSNLPSTQAVTLAVCPLPVGAATSALQPSLDADGGAKSHVTNLPTIFPMQVAATTITPSGGTFTTANTAQNIMPIAATRTGFFFVCSADAWLNFAGAAVAAYGGSSIFVPGGSMYESPSHLRPVGAVSAICASTASYSAAYW